MNKQEKAFKAAMAVFFAIMVIWIGYELIKPTPEEYMQFYMGGH